jgi:hypothetical protein
MTAATALRLARPAAAADRGRFGLVAAATAAAGTLLLALAHILRLPAEDAAGTNAAVDDALARYVTEAGLRPGVAITAVLLMVPVIAFTLQALRIGSVARDRRMASLRLAGATPREVRVIAAAEAAGAAAAGALVAGPAFLALWILLGVLPPAGARLLATPAIGDAAAWAALLPLAALAGAAAGAAVHGRVLVEPLSVRHRAAPPPPGPGGTAALLAGLALPIGGLAGAQPGAAGEAPLALAIAGLVMAGLGAVPRLVLAGARLLARRPGADALLASRRLRADPRSAGGVAGVLFACVVTLGVEGSLLASQVQADGFSDDAAFYLGGFGLAALAVLVAAGVTLLALLVGAADGLLDARRPLAALSVLGVDEDLLVRALARQLTATAIPAVLAGAFVAGPGLLVLLAATGEGLAVAAIVPLVAGGLAALAAGLLIVALARQSARALRPLVRTAIDPGNLRAA